MFYRLSNDAPLDARSFVEFYSAAYYTEDGDSTVATAPEHQGAQRLIRKLVKGTPRHIERAIDGIIDRDRSRVLTCEEVVFILMWKLGSLNKWQAHYSISDRGIDVDRDVRPNGRKGTIDAWGIARKAVDLQREWFVERHSPNAGSFAEKVISSFQDTQGLGATYICTLLYFITQAEWPIYDFFSARALTAISRNQQPGSRVEMKPFPDKTSIKSVVNALENFREQIDAVLADDAPAGGFASGYEKYKECRDIDRALWVYGHLFA